MKKNKVFLNIFTVIAAVLYAVIMILGNVQTAGISMAVIEGSYADVYAEKNKLNKVSISDSEQKYFDIRYEKEVQTETKDDSEFMNFPLEDIPFEYNENANSIEITKYRAGKELDIMPEGMIVIPSYVNGKPVTMVSMDMVGDFAGVVVPETVTEITGETKTLIYSAMFVLETVFTLLAFLVALIAVNIILPRYENKEEFFLSGSQMVLTIFYVAV